MIFGATCKRTKHRTKPRTVYRWKVRAIADSARVTGQAGSKTDRPDSRHYFRFVWHAAERIGQTRRTLVWPRVPLPVPSSNAVSGPEPVSPYTRVYGHVARYRQTRPFYPGRPANHSSRKGCTGFALVARSAGTSIAARDDETSKKETPK